MERSPLTENNLTKPLIVKKEKCLKKRLVTFGATDLDMVDSIDSDTVDSDGLDSDTVDSDTVDSDGVDSDIPFMVAYGGDQVILCFFTNLCKISL